MRDDGPSFTARGVALARSGLVRPATPTGDPGADERLAATLADGFTERALQVAERNRFLGYLPTRTAFFDDAVLAAVRDQVPQVVILGAGYDGRSLRFRSPGTRFFEVDHPATQRDKRERLASVAAAVDDVAFVTADFTQPGLAGALERAGHDAHKRSLFVCEGVLRYLPEEWFHTLLRTAAERAAAESRLAVSIATREAGVPSDEQQRDERLAAIGEPVLTVPDRATALAWLTAAGWSVEHVADASRDPGRGHLLVTAQRR